MPAHNDVVEDCTPVIAGVKSRHQIDKPSVAAYTVSLSIKRLRELIFVAGKPSFHVCHVVPSSFDILNGV